ncbi:UNVERIFIED_CONTAM: hypothetical protein Sangu_2914500 [Sesamum angustifolium]|uniref:Reverse transcriptase n=1 Tax=Sesamum angustifolium TaxID=2727405 RepID=A0AAW2IL39_9LAMI
MECLREFKDVFDLAVNTSKSSIFTAGIENNEFHGILARTDFTKGEMPVWYLGIPLTAQRLSARDYSPLVDQIANCIFKWVAKSLFFVGRLELIRSVIQGVECFGSKSSHVWWRWLKKSTTFAGIFFETLEEHQLLGKKFAIPNMKAALVYGTFSHEKWPSLPAYYGTSTTKQTRCGCNRSTVSIFETAQFGIGNRRREQPILPTYTIRGTCRNSPGS